MLVTGCHHHFGTKNVCQVILWVAVSMGHHVMMMMMRFLLSLPVELMHHSSGDGLSDGGGTVARRANDIIA